MGGILIKNDNIRSIVRKYYENKMSHVFLVETNDKCQTLKDLIELIKIINCEQNYVEECSKCNLCHLITHDSLPSLKIISPDGQTIRKEQMEELKNIFSSQPYFSKYNVYVINEAEKFNASSANTMLKFIEEPEKNIIGFLITNNRENVINTIKSRCEIVKANYIEGENELSPRLYDLAIQYLKRIEFEKKKSILYNQDLLDEKLEKEDFLVFFKVLLSLFLKVLNREVLPDGLEKLKEKEISEILRKIQLITEIIGKLNYNVNMNLLLDDFVLRMEAC